MRLALFGAAPCLDILVSMFDVAEIERLQALRI